MTTRSEYKRFFNSASTFFTKNSIILRIILLKKTIINVFMYQMTTRFVRKKFKILQLFDDDHQTTTTRNTFRIVFPTQTESEGRGVRYALQMRCEAEQNAFFAVSKVDEIRGNCKLEIEKGVERKQNARL